MEILGFPCNQFGEQEPGTNEEAATFCQMSYGVSFSIFAKVDVNGKNASPLFYYLKKKAPFQGFDESNISNKLLKMMIAEKYPEFSMAMKSIFAEIRKWERDTDRYIHSTQMLGARHRRKFSTDYFI